ncbi:hypothetical protein CMO91_05970 [Candidatus Woesearchaeota archaeon]|nr:hypothetical protein [Candidatus Woesearchaeota archaeon]|tara:strand:- start:944 stop:1402 length:459 start_codon:yes stop_codon:yes gene_type:complete
MRWELLLILLVACAAPEVHVDRVPADMREPTGVPASVPISSGDQQPEVPEVSPEPQPEGEQVLKTFEIEAFQFGYEPSTIEVNQGDRVQITAWSRDVPHGLRIREFGLNMELRDKTPVTAEFVASKKGEYSYRCSIPCGHGHRDMEGTLIVK